MNRRFALTILVGTAFAALVGCISTDSRTPANPVPAQVTNKGTEASVPHSFDRVKLALVQMSQKHPWSRLYGIELQHQQAGSYTNQVRQPLDSGALPGAIEAPRMILRLRRQETNGPTVTGTEWKLTESDFYRDARLKRLGKDGAELCITEGPPKEGPYTSLVINRVGENSTHICVQTTRWSAVWGNRRVKELEAVRIRELLLALPPPSAP